MVSCRLNIVYQPGLRIGSFAGGGCNGVCIKIMIFAVLTACNASGCGCCIYRRSLSFHASAPLHNRLSTSRQGYCMKEQAPARFSGSQAMPWSSPWLLGFAGQPAWPAWAAVQGPGQVQLKEQELPLPVQALLAKPPQLLSEPNWLV